ncbi:MAG: N-acetyltransferase family protein [Brachybacterium sp.]|uniref:GNAT family N-acetyltransferase n=1 Tax=Brachybacterium sp. TaxID=1891286 RepID=UPI002652F4AA|nr:N-acetyltransferase family protein [Brachybacterium sp.]MDN6330128.1 N-acetyltransferase family protein [Brachybacterium sp.]
MQILDATAQHAGGIAAIYNHAVEHTTAIWNERLVDAADRAAWLAERQGSGFPVLVALEDDGTVLGYATYGPWRPHDGYRHTVEHSLYVREGLRGRGTGSALLTALLERARAQGIHVMVAGIDASNEGSVRLHERFGFTRVGVLPQVGTKFGRWLDLAFLQLVLDQAPPAGGGSSGSR